MEHKELDAWKKSIDLVETIYNRNTVNYFRKDWIWKFHSRNGTIINSKTVNYRIIKIFKKQEA